MNEITALRASLVTALQHADYSRWSTDIFATVDDVVDFHISQCIGTALREELP
jgi:hypothetical protein